MTGSRWSVLAGRRPQRRQGHGFVVWARQKLYAKFREQATRSLSPFRYVAPPLVPPPVAAPPVIQRQA